MHVVEDAVREELGAVRRVRGVELAEPRLALVVLVQVAGLERDARVRLVGVDRERVLQVLDGQVLADGLELVARPGVVDVAAAPPLLVVSVFCAGGAGGSLAARRRRSFDCGVPSP